MTWVWPLPNVSCEVPTGTHHGAFGIQRKFDIHTGVDLYCDEDQEVCAVEDGIVSAVSWFTGEFAESPWWNNTKAIVVEGSSGAVCYGELIEVVSVGQKIHKGEVIGRVKRVLKKDKGLPTSMLHLELYRSGVIDHPWWKLGQPQPETLQDPTNLLVEAKETK